MLSIPLTAAPSQKLSVQLAGQTCVIKIKQRSTGLYCDLSVNGIATLVGCLCRDRTVMVRSAYLGFIGDIAFVDTTPARVDPDYTGLGSRFILVYFSPAELSPFTIV